MNPESLNEAREIFSGISEGLTKNKKAAVVICPSFAHLAPLAEMKKDNLILGAQDVSGEPKGAFTGEVSAAMLKDLGASYVIVGHSERRKAGETNDSINKKILLVLKSGLMPILCVGESERNDDGRHLMVVREQIEKALAGMEKKRLPSLVVAYEPVFAIGAATAMEARDVHEMILFIKKVIVEMFKLKTADGLTVLYGGAVDGANAKGILTVGAADGLLVGRQSLDPKSFLDIIACA